MLLLLLLLRLLLLLLCLLQVPRRAPDLPYAPLGGPVQTQWQAHKPRLLRQGARLLYSFICQLLLRGRLILVG
jgi:hypothetical protein